MRARLVVSALCLAACQQETLMAPDPPGARWRKPSAVATGAPSIASVELAPAPAPTLAKPLERAERPGRKQRIDELRAAQKAAALGRLREIQGKDFNIVLDDVARRGLPKVKDTAIAFIKHSLDEIGTPALTASAEDLTATLTASFAEAGLSIGEEQSIGGLLSLSVVRPAGHAARIAVSFSVEFGRGGDDVLAIFEQRGGELVPVLVRRVDGYKGIGEARWASNWAIAPPAGDGSWFVVDAHSHAWISSLWRGIHYVILEPGPRADQPKQLIEGDDDAYLGDEAIGSVTASASTATIDYGSWDLLSGEHTRNYRRSFSRDASGGFKRSAPFVYSPRDFVHELRDGDEALARSMALPAAADKAAELHKKMKAAKNDTATGSLSFKDQPDVELEALKSPATVVFDCAGCSQLPKYVELVAERVGESWMIRSLSFR